MVAETERELKRGLVAQAPSLKESQAAVKKMLMIAQRSDAERGHDASWLEKRAQMTKAGSFNSASLPEGLMERVMGGGRGKGGKGGKKGGSGGGGGGGIGVNALHETERERDERIALSVVKMSEGKITQNTAMHALGRTNKYETAPGKRGSRFFDGEDEGEEGGGGGGGKHKGKGGKGGKGGHGGHGGKKGGWKPKGFRGKGGGKGKSFGGKGHGGAGRGHSKGRK